MRFSACLCAPLKDASDFICTGEETNDAQRCRTYASHLMCFVRAIWPQKMGKNTQSYGHRYFYSERNPHVQLFSTNTFELCQDQKKIPAQPRAFGSSNSVCGFCRSLDLVVLKSVAMGMLSSLTVSMARCKVKENIAAHLSIRHCCALHNVSASMTSLTFHHATTQAESSTYQVAALRCAAHCLCVVMRFFAVLPHRGSDIAPFFPNLRLNDRYDGSDHQNGECTHTRNTFLTMCGIS